MDLPTQPAGNRRVCPGDLVSANPLANDKRPNVLLIVVDDMDYSDIGTGGGENRMPTLDALAESGMIFSDFDKTPTCSPNSSMLLSGVETDVDYFSTPAHNSSLGVN